MKPKNFPGRKSLRKAKAGNPKYARFLIDYTSDISLRVGFVNRDAEGMPRSKL
jgi:hypothetical protein